jgi:3-oxoacyl-(acyl-carrier-protein) synthase
LTGKSVYIGGTGIISPLGSGSAATEKTLRENRSALQPLELFALLQGSPLPVGQVFGLDDPSPVPRTHQLARIAARQAMDGSSRPPDAIILGTTTGGILTTEQLLRNGEQQKMSYRYHGLNTVADYLAEEFGCPGPAIVVSTACSSGVVAITMALALLRGGQAGTVLAGGVDALCRLTYFGFHSLQLVDRAGCRPLDRNRQGMAVAEGAGMVLLTTEKPAGRTVELLGAGLSCDAYHPAAPHPEGRGAFIAMRNALADAGLRPEDIDYINLHGTGTPENDLAESKAVRRLFTTIPPLSSIKGASGHSLAAAGAIETVVSTIAVSRGLMPANTGLQTVDPALGLTPLTRPLERSVSAVLSNSFGFGGNNGSLVIGRPDTLRKAVDRRNAAGLAIHGYSCLTGAGDTAATLARIQEGGSAAGMAGLETMCRPLPPRLIRRLKRLAKMTLSLAVTAEEKAAPDERKPGAVFMGTGWGALSETHDFLSRLTDSREQFPSPTDFVGSVHNGPAGQVAIHFGATGPNITTSGGDYSFEQALIAAELLLDDSTGPALVLGADEGHEILSPLLDPSIPSATVLADGGGGLLVSRRTEDAGWRIAIPFFRSSKAADAVGALVDSLCGESLDGKNNHGYAIILAGIPAAMRREGEEQLAQFIARAKLSVPVVDYRTFTGEFASASAVAAALAASFLEAGSIPGALTGGRSVAITGHADKILVLGLGRYLTAMELFKP